LYGDEKTIYRQPAAALVYHERGRGGRHQAKATRSYHANTKYRLAGALDAVSGRHHVLGRSKVGIRALRAFLQQLRAAYGPEREVTLAWDNWPVHKHPEVEAEARAQRIALLYLPTYAPWTNPEEKVWRKLEEEQLRMHRLAARWDELKAQSLAFLQQYDKPSPELLRYVGL
jgi:transposase